MKKIGIRLLIVVVLIMTLLLGIVGSAYAAKPVRLGITITDISDGSITVNYWWNKIGAHYYAIGVYNSTNDAMNYTGQINLGGRTPSRAGSLTLTSPQITCNQTYRAIMWLYRKPSMRIHGATTQDYEFFECHLFEEDFTGVTEGSLPAGWATNNSNKVYVWNFNNAGGTIPELYIDYGNADNITYDYWACTPIIDATATTTTLDLTFKHDLWVYNWSRNFTYSIEVSNDGGSTWTAVREETPTETTYPSMEIGPETVNIDLSAYLGNNILIRWRLRGYTWYSDGWRIDDITVDGS